MNAQPKSSTLPTMRDHDSLETVQEACRMGMVALKMQIPRSAAGSRRYF